MVAHRAITSSVFEELADAIGEPLARRLCEHLGGIELYVPVQITENHPVALAIGHKEAQIFASRFRGSHVRLPKAYNRRQRVLELSERGTMTVKEIALATDYTERHVYGILAEAAEQQQRAQDQFDLFG